MKFLLPALLILLAPDSAQAGPGGADAAYAAEQLAVDACAVEEKITEFGLSTGDALNSFNTKKGLVQLAITHGLITYIRTALDTDPEGGGGGVANTEFYTAAGRTEMAKKALMNVLPAKVMFAQMDDAQDSKANGLASESSTEWTYAQAVYTGTATGTRPLKADGEALDTPVAAAGCTAYAAANKLCKNFGTCVATSATATDLSYSNLRIMTAFGRGVETANVAEIKELLCLVNFQAVLRYANKIDRENAGLDTDSLGKNLGEGQAFTLATEGCLKGTLNAGKYDTLMAIFDTTAGNTKETNYDDALVIVNGYVAAHPNSLTSAVDLGVLNEKQVPAQTAERFCKEYQDKCANIGTPFKDTEACRTFYTAAAPGTVAVPISKTAAGATRACYQYHLSAVPADAAVHCPHARGTSVCVATVIPVAPVTPATPATSTSTVTMTADVTAAEIAPGTTTRTAFLTACTTAQGNGVACTNVVPGGRRQQRRALTKKHGRGLAISVIVTMTGPVAAMAALKGNLQPFAGCAQACVDTAAITAVTSSAAIRMTSAFVFTLSVIISGVLLQ